MESNASCIIALTGGIACGKSLVRDVFKTHGFCSFEADRVAHAQCSAGTELNEKIIELYGETICDISGNIDRTSLAKIVFSDEHERQALNALVHPVVFQELQNWMAHCRKRNLRGIAEIPLLFECGWERLSWKKVICVAADNDVVNERLMARGLNRSECASRIASQWPVEKKCAQADEVIWNSQSIRDVEKRTNDLIDRLR